MRQRRYPANHGVSFSLGVVLFLGVTAHAWGNRVIMSLHDDWRFVRQNVAGAEEPDYADDSWELVDVPHTWNAKDGFDPHPGYYRGVGSYRKHFHVDSKYRNKQILLVLESACQVSEVWLNGHYLGRYFSGYTGLSINITQHVSFDDKGNLLALRIDNSNNRDVPPWSPEDFKAFPRSVDFNVYGGINGEVQLIITDNLRIEATAVTTPAVSALSAVTRVTTEVKNHYDSPVTCVLRSELLDSDDRVVDVVLDSATLQPFEKHTFLQEGKRIDRPRLWSPVHPHLYRMRLGLFIGNRKVDEVEILFGMRWFEWKPFQGLYLNGEKLYLRGVSRHQEFPGQGNALSNEQHRTDMELIKSLGANYVRLAHYPQDPAVLDACDRLGLVVWEEIPVAISVGGTPGFVENSLHILKEMIRRDRNHPSILFWGLMNEATAGIPFAPGVTEQDAVDLVIQLNDLAHTEDPTRLTIASGVTPAVSKHVDVDVPQFWYGWLEGDVDDYGKALDERHRTDPYFMGGSYGASGHVGRHTTNPVRMDYSETYQCLLHESYLKQGEARSSWYPGACAWTAFDFGSNREDRAKNPLPYVNQKGLFDARRNPKDVYYLYKSYWTDAPAFAYIVSRTWTHRVGRSDAEHQIRVYSNCPEVELFLDGVSQGVEQRNDGFVWKVKFREGINELKAEGINRDGDVVSSDRLEVSYSLRSNSSM